MNVFFDSAEEKLAPLIGQFIIDFLYIEDLMACIVEENLSMLSHSYIKNNSKFEYRLKSFNVVISSYASSIDVENTLPSIILKLNDMYKIRNLLAHNSLGLVAVSDMSGFLINARFEISGKRTNTVENLNSLKLKVDELRELRDVLVGLLERYYNFKLKK